MRTRDEELGRLVVGKRRHGELVLRRDVERCAARHDYLQRRRCGEQVGNVPCRGKHLLEVVDEQEQLRARERPGQLLLRVRADLGNLERLEDRPRHVRRFAQRRDRGYG